MFMIEEAGTVPRLPNRLTATAGRVTNARFVVKP